jgi:hypothetical protein
VGAHGLGDAGARARFADRALRDGLVEVVAGRTGAGIRADPRRREDPLPNPLAVDGGMLARHGVRHRVAAEAGVEVAGVEAQALHQAEAGAVEQHRDDPRRATQLRRERAGLGGREDDRQRSRALGAGDVVEPAGKAAAWVHLTVCLRCHHVRLGPPRHVR